MKFAQRWRYSRARTSLHGKSFPMEVEMRNVKWLLAAGLIAATTAGCVESNGYPSTAYNSGYSNGYYNSGYYRNGAPSPLYNIGHAYHSTARRGPYRDPDPH